MYMLATGRLMKVYLVFILSFIALMLLCFTSLMGFVIWGYGDIVTEMVEKA